MPLCRVCKERDAEIVEVTGYLVDPDSALAPPELPAAPPGPTLCHPCFVARFPAFFQPYVSGAQPIPDELLAIWARMDAELAREVAEVPPDPEAAT